MTLDEFYAAKSGVSLLWMGNDGWVVNLHGCIISMDLDFYSRGRVPLPEGVDLVRLAREIRYAFATHEHGDHFNEETCLFLQKHSRCQFVLAKSCYQRALEIGIDDERIVVATPRTEFELDGGLSVSVIRAVHGHFKGSVYRGANMGDCGYVIKHGGFSLYQPGDTVLLDEHFTMGDIDLLFFSPTEHNMHIDNSVEFIRLVKPRHIVPQHYDSYEIKPDNAFWTRGFPDEVYAKLTEDEQWRFVKFTQGKPKPL
jgi:L-ascorbate metabolism protein UlaG (beta-lactamase superfamily)